MLKPIAAAIAPDSLVKRSRAIAKQSTAICDRLATTQPRDEFTTRPATTVENFASAQLAGHFS